MTLAQPSKAIPDAETAQVAEQVVQPEVKRRWVSYIWDTFDKSPEERRFLTKLDGFILTFASLGYFIKYLDQININNAFVTGMKEDLSLYGNELNYMQASWTVGYVLGQIPSNLILTRIRPRYWLPTLEVFWTVLTFAMSRADTARTIYVLRFFIGLAESSFYPGMQYVIGSWYRGDELAKRSCIFHTSSALGSMFSGYLMAAVQHLNGVHGFRGWQWLFIVDGIISLPIALAGYFMLPDVPEIASPWFLSKTEVTFAQKRMDLEGRAPRAPYTKAKILRIFKSWHIYFLVALYVFFNNGSAGGQPVFAQFLKESTNPRYSTTQINTYPTISDAVQVITTLIYAWTSDSLFRGRRYPAIIFQGLFNILIYSSLAAWDIPPGYKWFCYIMSGSSGAISGLCMAWAHEICSGDNEERALVIGGMNMLAYVVQSWLPLVVWRQVEAPRYRKGFVTVSCLGGILVVTAGSLKWLQDREEKTKRLQTDNQTEDVSSASSPRLSVDGDTGKSPVTVSTV